ncbi:MAG: DNA-binding transcriptional regulator [Parvibaculum sp.]
MSEKPAEIQPIIRALQVLEALNLKTQMTLAALNEATGLPKSTLVRLLDTLIAGGYVHRVSRRAGYAVAERALRLSGGFRHADRVVEAARPFLSALTAEHKWPIGMATPEGDQMIVRASTRQESPFATDNDYLGERVPMLVSALGRVYFAFCAEEERETLLALMRNSKARRNALARDETAVARLVEAIRAQGFASTAPMPDRPVTGLAVPVMEDGRAVAAITMRYFGSAMTEAEAARRYLAPMQRAAAAIASGL